MFVLILAACSSAPPPPPALPPGFHTVGIQQLKEEIVSTRAKPRIYNFWATWCGPCLRELPELKRIGESRSDVDLVLVNVDLPSLHDTKVQATLARLDLTAFRSLGLVDPDPAFALTELQGWPNSLPVTFLVTPDGTRYHQFNVAVEEGRLLQALDGLSATP